jgi:hypothetical protein
MGQYWIAYTPPLVIYMIDLDAFLQESFKLLARNAVKLWETRSLESHRTTNTKPPKIGLPAGVPSSLPL